MLILKNAPFSNPILRFFQSFEFLGISDSFCEPTRYSSPSFANPCLHPCLCGFEQLLDLSVGIESRSREAPPDAACGRLTLFGYRFHLPLVVGGIFQFPFILYEVVFCVVTVSQFSPFSDISSLYCLTTPSGCSDRVQVKFIGSISSSAFSSGLISSQADGSDGC